MDDKDLTKRFMASIPIEDKDIVDLILKYKGVIFGGYIRDMYSNIKPTDLDTFIPEMFDLEFLRSAKNLGYTRDKTRDEEYITKPGSTPVEIVFTDENPDEVRLTPEVNPDFNINTLALDINGLFIWNLGHPEWEDPNLIQQIIDDIKNHRAKQLEYEIYNEEDRKLHIIRIEKMKRKGYTIY